MIKIVKKLTKSFFYAFRGVWWGFATRKNLFVFTLVALLVFPILKILHLSKGETAVIMLAWLVVIVVEIVNTSIEQMVDVVHPDFHEGFGLVKDIAAGAVLFSIVSAIIVSLLIIWDPMMLKLQ
ncbi:MAG: diacylglycerol kinase, partial [Candidatus Goldiibacteriota bacterium]